MASNIISETIDGDYPVAGVDNDSQGFRDNFTIIKDNFAIAALEITDLQDNAARTDTDTAFDNNTISVVNLKQTTQEYSDEINPGISGSGTVSFNQAHYFRIKILGTTTLTFEDFPTTDPTQYAEVRVQIYGDGNGGHAVTFAGATSNNFVDVDSAWTGRTLYLTSDLQALNEPDNSVLPTDRSILIKAFTFDGGTNIHFKYEGTFAPIA